MSYIRPLNDGPKWVDEADTEGLYVYSDGRYIHGMPRRETAFVEVVMRMLDQSDVLDDEELEKVHQAFSKRLRWIERDNKRNVQRGDATMGIAQAVVFCEEHGYDEEEAQLREIFQTLENDDLTDDGATGPDEALEALPDEEAFEEEFDDR